MKNIKQNKGFTLIEILVVIGIIAILAAIVLIAINPARQFRQANNSQRTANVNALLNAIGQYMVDNKGAMPGDITASVQDISDDEADICMDLIDESRYMPALPADPNETDQSIVEGDCSNYDTGYTVEEENGRVVVCAPQAEDVDDGGVGTPICVTR